MCGFEGLSREERVIRANEILTSNDLKQAICHQILGTTFKDIERAMDSILKERQLTPVQEEEVELRNVAPEKFEPVFDPELEFKFNKKAASPKKQSGYSHYTREEAAWLIAASEAPYEQPEAPKRKEYPTYSREQVEQFVREHYEHIAREQEFKKEKAKWDSLKTTEFDPKIKPATEP